MFSTPLGLLALAGVPLVVALHLFQRRFQRREVSALFLWGLADTHSPSGRTRQRLIRSKSFWFEVLAALLLGLALGGPRAACTGSAGHLVVVLDSSASMGALDIEGTLDATARELVGDRIGELSADARVTVIASGPRPSLVAGPAVTRVEARQALDDWRPGRGRHDLTPSIALARGFAGEGAVLLVTDHYQPDAWPEEVELLALGRPMGNLALVGAARVRTAGTSTGERATVTVANLAGSARLAQVRVLTAEGPEQELFRESLQLQPGARERLSFDLPAGTPAVEVRLGDDELAMDNHAWLAPAPDRRLALFSPLEPELRLALALDSGAEDRPLDRLLGLIPEAYAAADAESADLVVAGATSGSARTWTLAVEAPGDERRELLGPFLKDLRDPALGGLTLDGVVWSHAPGHQPLGEPLISVAGTALLTRADDGQRRTYHLSMDPRRSTLQRSPDWPILLTNLAEERRAALPGPSRTNLRTGELLRVSAEAPGRYLLEGPDGQDRELAGGRVLLVELPEVPGLYRLWRLVPASPTPPGAPGEIVEPAAAAASPADEQQLVALLAVNLVDPAESDLSGLSRGQRAATVALSETAVSTAWLEALLALAALGLVLADGFVLGGHRLRRELTPGELDKP